MKLPVAAGLATAAVTVTLYPLFEGGAWFWSCFGAILVATVAGLAVSLLGARPWVAPAASFVAVLLYLTLVFTPEEAWLRIVPTKDSIVRLAELVGSGFDDIQRYAAPVPDDPGITLLTTAGVALIALLVDVLAVRLRRAALAGLPLLALFTVPAAVVTEPIGWIAFVIAAFGYIGLLVADGRERLSRWGRAVVVRRSSGSARGAAPDTERLALSGKRIGVTAIALAILVPAALPALSPDPLFGFGVGNGFGGGGGNIGIPDAIAKLGGQLRQQRNATVLTYTSSDDVSRYLRIYSLDIFDGTKWTLAPLRGRPEDRVSEGPLPPTPGLRPGVSVKRAEMRVTMSEDIGTLNFLPLPYPARQVEADGDWRADRDSLMVFSTEDEAAGMEYRVVTEEPEPTLTELRTAVTLPDSDRYLQLPDGLDPRVAALARRVTADATTPYEAAVELQEWFTQAGRFTYDVRASGSGAQALSRFLLRDRRGYCEQFAGAMAVMARLLNIPARVSVGYTGGTKIDNVWTVRTHDTHAWPELFFDGIGWLRFEPTPAGTGGQGTAQVPSYSLPVTPTADPTAGPSAGPTSDEEDTGQDAGPVRPNPRQLDRDLDGTAIAADPGTPVAVKAGIGAAAALALLLLPAAARLLVRRRRLGRLTRTAADGHAAWAELRDTLTDLGMAGEPGETPRALGRRIAGRHPLGPQAAESLARVVTSEERLRYAPTPSASGPVPADLRHIRRDLAARTSRWRRLGAALAPMSVLLRVRAAGEGVLDVFDRLEGLRLRLWRTGRTGTRETAAAARRPGAAAGSGDSGKDRTLTGARR
ncbi:transglutaminase TgpA family protein [Microbispora sp. CA-135349]|uniref:transglutaminase family protein n=1 Tax=Microbispora sp. CA-135349 TaxID=3239953 RepID=UPI003D91AB3C